MKIVLNKCYGGFGLSPNATEMYRKLEGIEKNKTIYSWEIERSNPSLIKVVEDLGDDADGDYASLKIVEIPNDCRFEIEDYDGIETVYYGTDFGRL